MKHSFPTKLIRTIVAASMGCLLSFKLRAQTVILAAPSGSAPAAVAQQLASGKKVPAPASNIASALAAGRPIFASGPFVYRGSLNYRFLYGNGLQTAPGNPESSVIQSAGLASNLSIGNHWSMSYTPTATYYSNDAFRNTLDHTASVSGGYSAGDWTLTTSGNYARTSDTLLEIGAQTTREIFGGATTVTRNIGEKTSIDLSVGYDVSLATGLVSSRTLSTSDWLRYQVSPRLNVGAGFAFGYSFLDTGPDVSYTRPQVRMAWRPNEKFSLSADGGYEYRAFRTGGVNRLGNPVYSASLKYQPVPVTGVSVAASSSETGSYFASQATRGDEWTIGLEQRLLQRFFVSGGISFRRTRYIIVDQGLAIGRSDKTRFFTGRVSTSFLRRGTIGLFHNANRNASNTFGFSITSRQTGVDIVYNF
jgi:hypothetical protein